MEFHFFFCISFYDKYGNVKMKLNDLTNRKAKNLGKVVKMHYLGMFFGKNAHKTKKNVKLFCGFIYFM